MSVKSTLESKSLLDQRQVSQILGAGNELLAGVDTLQRKNTHLPTQPAETFRFPIFGGETAHAVHFV